MAELKHFDPSIQTVGLNRNLSASIVPARPDPPEPVDGVTIGVVTMTENSPHDGEMHPDGDEVLYLISGRARVTIETAPVEEFEMAPGDGLNDPKGVWHRVHILEPSQIVFVTPGPGGEYRPLGSTG